LERIAFLPTDGDATRNSTGVLFFRGDDIFTDFSPVTKLRNLPRFFSILIYRLQNLSLT